MAPVSICHLNEDILPSLVADGTTDLNKIKFDEYFSVMSLERNISTSFYRRRQGNVIITCYEIYV